MIALALAGATLIAVGVLDEPSLRALGAPLRRWKRERAMLRRLREVKEPRRPE